MKINKTDLLNFKFEKRKDFSENNIEINIILQLMKEEIEE